MRRSVRAIPRNPTLTRRAAMTASLTAASAIVSRRIGAQPATTAASPTTVGYFESDWLVDPTWLMDRRDDPTVKIVALTPTEDFAAGHIPGAAQVDWPELEVTDTSDPAITRWQVEIETILTDLRLSPTDTVVVYDGGRSGRRGFGGSSTNSDTPTSGS